MKITLFATFLLLALEALALPFDLPRFNRNDDRDGGLRAVWSCPTPNRGDMPQEREVEAYYDEMGNLKFRPDIFKMRLNIGNEIRSLFKGRRPSSDVDECLRVFLTTMPQAIQAFQSSQCEGSRLRICTQSPQNIMLDVNREIRGSKFFRNYENDLSSVAVLLTPQNQRGPENILPDQYREGGEQDNPGTTGEQLTIIESDTTELDTPESTTPQETTSLPETTSPQVPTTPQVITTPEVTITPQVITTPQVTTNPQETTNPTVIEETISLPRPNRNEERARAQLLDYMTDNYSKFRSIREFASHCPELGNTSGVNASYCRFHMRNNASFLTRLSQMFTAVRGENISVERLVSSLQCLPNGVSEFTGIEEVLRSLDRKDDCSPLNSVGDYKLFRKSHGPSWYTSGNYLLKKTGEDEFEATLNIRFNQAGGSGTPAQMMGRVRSCLSAANGSMTGPGGSRLRIRALTPEEATDQLRPSERPAVDEINIRPSGTAVDSLNFVSDVDCPTIVHELLHHMGLCDEYREDRTNLVHGMSRSRAVEWSCRVVPSGPSIMKNHVEAYNMAVPQQFSCECVNEACRSALRSSSQMGSAQRKLLMTASMYSILGRYSQYCPNPVSRTGIMAPSNPDKAFVNVQVNGGTLTFSNRNLFAQGNQFAIGERTVTCQCPADDPTCPPAFAAAAERLRLNPVQDSCPLHTTAIGEREPAREGAQNSVSSNSYTIVTTPSLPSLLTPNQFDKILTGACMSSPSALFKRCSEYAYISQDSPACANKPQECNNNRLFTGVDQQ